MKRFICTDTSITGLTIIERTSIADARGFLSRLYCEETLKEVGLDQPIKQINQTLTRQAGAVRGLHYQLPPHAETKFVSCIKGKVFDVAVDLRQDSPTFLKWFGQILSEENQKSLLIPEGFAHGFQTLSEDCEMLYLHTACYAPKSESGINALDASIGIKWPLPITEMSDRDQAHLMLQASFKGIEL